MAKMLTGMVTSDKNDKTIVVTVRTRKTHPLYKKQYTVNTKFMAHDEKNDAVVGDRVSILEGRPQSARKRFNLHKIIERGGAQYQASDSVSHLDEQVLPVDEVKEVKPASSPKAKPAKAKAEETTE